MLSCGSALIAESEAILEGVTFARNLQLRKVIITTDSLDVINNIKNPLTHGC
jgi:ribonuclease HI